MKDMQELEVNFFHSPNFKTVLLYNKLMDELSYSRKCKKVNFYLLICGGDHFLFDSRVRVPDENRTTGASTDHPGATGADTTSRRNTECLQDGYDYY
jgi:hypothetical protein